MERRTMLKHLFLGSAGSLLTIVGTQAADLPTGKAAPTEYVRICDAYGASFFYIPGTDMCLKLGGLALFEARTFNTPHSIDDGFYSGSSPRILKAGLGSFGAAGEGPSATDYRNARSRDNYGFGATGRVELDARTGTSYGALRGFLRVDSSFGSSSSSQTGALNQLYNTTAGPFPAKEQTIVNKAFVQFAGLTAGRAQSMFDFYADAYNYEALRGSNANPALLAYTYTFDGPFTGLSATISVEDGVSRREQIGSVLSWQAVPGTGAPPASFGIPAIPGGFSAFAAGQQIPDLVANVSVDQPWGSAQLSGAAHQLRTTLYPPLTPAAFGVLGNPAVAGLAANSGVAAVGSPNPFATQNDWGFAVQGGVKINTPWIAPDDTLFIQATYEAGAIGYISGNTLAYKGGFWASSLNYGNGAGATPTSNGWVENTFSDCVWTLLSRCEKQQGGALVVAFKHYWLPTWSSGFYGSLMAVRYNADVNTPTLGNVLGVPNYKELRAGTNLVWTPVTGFDIGAEIMFTRGVTDKPFGLANDLVLTGLGLPTFSSTSHVYEGRLRVQRAF
jgi:hypothetical protein